MEIFGRLIAARGWGRMEDKVWGLRNVIVRYKIGRSYIILNLQILLEVQNNIGNGEAKELSMHDSWT